jgi:hypothetical protein
MVLGAHSSSIEPLNPLKARSEATRDKTRTTETIAKDRILNRALKARCKRTLTFDPLPHRARGRLEPTSSLLSD